MLVFASRQFYVFFMDRLLKEFSNETQLSAKKTEKRITQFFAKTFFCKFLHMTQQLLLHVVNLFIYSVSDPSEP
jgi:hypothetical protein